MHPVNTYNIPDSIYAAACQFPALEAIATGGGCDYITRKLSETVTLVLAATDDVGSPYRMDAPCSVVTFTDETWETFVSRSFENVPAALAYMVSVEGEARAVFAQLTPEQIAYAASEERGEFQGFAALHDLFDANMILPLAGSFNGTAEHMDRCNAVMDYVSELIIHGPDAYEKPL